MWADNLDHYHLEVALPHSAIRAAPVFWDILPSGTGGDPIFWDTLRLIVDISAYDAFPLFHIAVRHSLLAGVW